jgi:hypothetical protein
MQKREAPAILAARALANMVSSYVIFGFHAGVVFGRL